MTLEDFIIKWNGKYIDFDGVYGNQCMDLMHEYVTECLGLSDKSILAADCAKNVYLNFPNISGSGYFDQIANTPTGIPLEGDIILWGNTTYGHVAVFISGDANNFTSFDQNYPTGSPCHSQAHTYANVLGWLHPKSADVTNASLQAQLDQMRTDRDKNWNMFTAVCTTLGVGANVDAAVAEAKKLVGNDDVLVQKDKQITEAQTQINDLKSQLQVLTDSHNALQTSYNDLQSKFNEDTNTIADLNQKLTNLEKQITTPVYKGWKLALINLINKL